MLSMRLSKVSGEFVVGEGRYVVVVVVMVRAVDQMWPRNGTIFLRKCKIEWSIRSSVRSTLHVLLSPR